MPWRACCWSCGGGGGGGGGGCWSSSSSGGLFSVVARGMMTSCTAFWMSSADTLSRPCMRHTHCHTHRCFHTLRQDKLAPLKDGARSSGQYDDKLLRPVNVLCRPTYVLARPCATHAPYGPKVFARWLAYVMLPPFKATSYAPRCPIVYMPER